MLDFLLVSADVFSVLFGIEKGLGTFLVTIIHPFFLLTTALWCFGAWAGYRLTIKKEATAQPAGPPIPGGGLPAAPA